VRYLILLLVSCFFFACKPGPSSDIDSSEAEIFELLDSSKTQVQFRNNIIEGLNTNVLMYEYFYNGGGVATGDINGDGKIDLYFSSNMENNHLYLNQGAMVFKEIAEQAGVTGRLGPWKTGVSMVDINGDQKLDIYLCYSGNLPPEKKRNQLFINQGNDAAGNPRFLDQAAAYGLDSPANSTQAVFFDYDRDQDLDMILVNHNPKSLPVLDESSTADLLSKADENSGLQFFENSGSDKKFINKTKALGIQSSALSYGLAVGISDMNQDGWPDFYVSNDYTIPDFLYINQAGKGFKNTIESSMGHFSHFSMGNDIADVNNDLLPDVFTLDMLPEDNLRQKLLMSPDNYEKFNFNVRVGFGHQYMRNMLQMNQGLERGTKQVHFSEHGQLAGISNTDWSWSALFADYDNDGWKDLYVTNGYLRDYTNLDFLKYMGDYVQNNQSSIQRENVLELVQKMPASNVHNYMFKNQPGDAFKSVTTPWGLDRASNSNGAAYADLDQDGDLELIVNNINQAAFIYENKSVQLKKDHHFIDVEFSGMGGNTLGLGAKVWVYQQGKAQFFEQNLYRGFQSSVSPVMHIGLGKSSTIDSLRVVWNSGKTEILKKVASNKRLQLKESNAHESWSYAQPLTPIFLKNKVFLATNFASSDLNDFKRQTQLVHPMSFFGPKMITADIDQNGLTDIFVGAAAGNSSYMYKQLKEGSYVALPLALPHGIEVGDAEFLDVDGDKDFDLYIAAGGYGNMEADDALLVDHLFLNDGHGTFTECNLPKLLGSKSCVQKIDLNGDQLPDLFIGTRVIPGQYPSTPNSFVLQNAGKGKFVDVSAKFPGLQRIGMVSDAASVDLNQDGKSELIIVGDFMPIHVFSIQANQVKEVTETYFDQSPHGFWNKILVEDLNQDGKPEMVLGNVGSNTPWRASEKEPLELYGKDIDGNGSIDPILTHYVQGKKVPFMTRDELLDQISLMRTRFTDYQSFAEAEFTDIFTEDELKDAPILQVNQLKTALFSLGKSGKFESVVLPLDVQQSPVFTINVLDFNADGKKDLLLCGNMVQSKLRVGRMDANYGLLLQGNGKLGFSAVAQKRTGLWLKGDVRAVLFDGTSWLFGINQVGIQSYKIQ
jgi:hypothetical protein